MKLYFAIFCQDARVMENGALQINDPLVVLTADRKPAIHNGAVVLNFNPGDTEPHAVEVTVRAPYGKGGAAPYKAALTPAQFPGGNIGHIIYIDELILEEEGEYNIDVMIDGKKVTSIPFDFSVASCDCCPPPVQA